MNCPINEMTADKVLVGACGYHLPDGKTCPRHGDVSEFVKIYNETGKLTPENKTERWKRMFNHDA